MGSQFKLFRHNVFNFEVDIPNNWVFGVAGKPPGHVILMYPAGLNTGEFVPGYETIDVGILRQTHISLEAAHKALAAGMMQAHQGIAFSNDKSIGSLNGNESLAFSYSWPSKTGYTINENVSIVKYKDRIYTITIRTIEPISAKSHKNHETIIKTFKPTAPVKLP